ncbi:protein of unknown function [Clostridium beijerinckii]|nr:protein of unknown function [Clostridium beijerinckii]
MDLKINYVILIYSIYRTLEVVGMFINLKNENNLQSAYAHAE